MNIVGTGIIAKSFCNALGNNATLSDKLSDDIKDKLDDGERLWTCSTGYIFSEDELERWDVVNIHPSPLPYYRGANPLFQQLRDHKRVSAISLVQTEVAIDSGKILAQLPFEIHVIRNVDEFAALAGVVAARIVEDYMMDNFQFTRKLYKKDRIFTEHNGIAMYQNLAISSKNDTFHFEGSISLIKRDYVEGAFIHLHIAVAVPVGSYVEVRGELYTSIGKGWFLKTNTVQRVGKKPVSADTFMKTAQSDKGVYDRCL